MAGTIKVYSAVDAVVDGVNLPTFGSMVTPIKEAAITGGKRRLRLPFVVPFGQRISLWSWADTRGFDYAEIRLPKGGYLNLAWSVQNVNSEAFQSPTGAKQWNFKDMSCVSPHAFDSDRAYWLSSTSTYAGDTGGEPALWLDGTKVLGVISEFQVRNPSADTDVEGEIYIIGE